MSPSGTPAQTPRALRRSRKRKLLVKAASPSVITFVGWKSVFCSALLACASLVSELCEDWPNTNLSVRAAVEVRTVLLCSGDFKPWSKDELQTMKEAGDREAGKLEQETGAKPSASSSKAQLPSLPSPPSFHRLVI